MLDNERPSLECQLFSNQVWETIAFIAKAAFMVGLTPWMIRMWGAQGYGQFALASSTFVLLSLVDLGIRAKTRLALCSTGERDRAEWSNILAHSATTFAAIGALTIAASFTFSASGVLNSLFKISSANRNLLFITTTMSILVMLSGLLLEPLVAIGRIGKLKLATASGWFAAIPAVAFVLATKGSVIAALVSWLGCLLCANLFILFRNRAVFLGARRLRRSLELGKLVATLKESFWFNLCHAAWTAKTYGITLLISALNGPSAAGFFFILLRLSEIISALGAISSDVSLGELAQASSAKRRRQSFWSSYSWAVVFCSHIALVIAFCTRDFFVIWLHPTTQMSIFVGALVAALGFASAFNRTATYAAMGMGMAKTAARWGMIEATCFATAIVLSSHRFGLLAQLSVATLSAFALVPLAVAVSRKLMTSFSETWLQPFRSVAPFAAASALVLVLGHIADAWTLLVAIGISGFIAFANVLHWQRRHQLITSRREPSSQRYGQSLETNLAFPPAINAESPAS
jgi:O-antigen/teichoic acid export membrane protein